MRLIDGDELWNKAYEVWGLEADAGDTSIFMDMITDTPTIDPVKHGLWILNTDNFTPAKRCSCCGYNKTIVAGDRLAQEPENYCPNCGAFMLEDNDDPK